MKSELNFKIIKDGRTFDMHELDIWVERFHIHSPNNELSLINIPGFDGAVLSGSKMGVRDVDIELQLNEDSIKDFDDKKHLVYDLFYSREPYTIIRDFNNLEINVIQTESYDIENITCSDGYFPINLKMLDPYLYGPERTLHFTSDAVVVENKGTADAEPTFELTAKKKTTFAMVSNGINEHNLIGKPTDDEMDTPIEQEERIFWDEADSLIGWVDGNAVDGGVVTGEMKSNGYAFYANNFGTGGSWHGPAIQTSIPTTLKDFKVDVLVDFLNSTPQQHGRLEVYLYNENGDRIGKMALKDIETGRNSTHAEMMIGDASVKKFLISGPGSYYHTWNNFRGMIRIGRYGRTWFAYVAKINQETGQHDARMYKTYQDIDEQFTKNLAYIQVHLGAWGTRTPVNMRIHDIKVFKWNEITQAQIPYILDIGDTLIIDGENKEILINGEPRKDLKDFGGSFFNLKKGINSIIISPEDTFDVEMKFRERWV